MCVCVCVCVCVCIDIFVCMIFTIQCIPSQHYYMDNTISFKQYIHVMCYVICSGVLRDLAEMEVEAQNIFLKMSSFNGRSRNQSS